MLLGILVGTDSPPATASSSSFGGAKNSANNTTKGPSESLSLNFTEIHFSYSY